MYTDAQQGPLVQILRKWSLDMMFESIQTKATFGQDLCGLKGLKFC